MKKNLPHHPLKSIVLPFLALVAIALASTQVSATESITVTAIPPRVGDDGSLLVKPGEKIQTTIRVRNASPEKLTLRSIPKDYIVDQDGKTPIVVTGQTDSRWGIAANTLVVPNELILQPGETKAQQVLIEVPADALPGGKYVMISHSPTTETSGAPAELSGSGTNSEVGTLLYVTVDGPVNFEAFIRGLTLPRFTEVGPVPFSFAIENLSDVHITPQVSISFSDMLGKTVETIVLEKSNVFPYTSRSIEGQWNKVWGWGLYTATVSVSYGDGLLANSTSTFWLFPLTLVLVVATCVVILLTVIWSIKRHLNHRKSQQELIIAELQNKVSTLEEKTEHQTEESE